MNKVYPSAVVVILGAGLLLAGQNVQDSPDTSSVRGKIIFQGTLPVPPQINRASDPFCASLPPTNNGLEDVMVYVTPLIQTSFPPPGGTVILDRKDCQFVPHTV